MLKSYLAPWAEILGSAHRRLGYVDCFAGGGAYVDEENRFLPGSPLIALTLAKAYAAKYQGRSLRLAFVEKDRRTAEQLNALLESEGGSPGRVQYSVVSEDAQDFVQRLVSFVEEPGRSGRIIPSFFFVDPYGHPITIPVMRKLLQLGQTELLVNLMWFRLNMHLNNPVTQQRIDELFGHLQWRYQDFMSLHGSQRENAFVNYFVKEVGAKHDLRLLVPYSPEDRVRGRENRRKFYLIHFSNHPRAALLMKGILWGAKDEVAELQLAGQGGLRQLKLPGSEPDIDQLSGQLIQQFKGTATTFENIQIRTLNWRFIEKHYRYALKRMEKAGAVVIRRVESKKSGLKGRDIVAFP